MILIFTLWTLNLYVGTFQQHLQMEYSSLSWSDVRLDQDRLHKLCYPLSCLCYKWTLICSVGTDCRSLYLSSLMSCHHVWHMTCFWRQQHDKCHLSNTTLFTILSLCVSSFNGATLAQTLIRNVDYCLPFVISLSPFDLCPSVCWFWLHKCRLPTFIMLIGSQILIVFSSYFIFCSNLMSNQITSILEGTFDNLTSLSYL